MSGGRGVLEELKGRWASLEGRGRALVAAGGVLLLVLTGLMSGPPSPQKDTAGRQDTAGHQERAAGAAAASQRKENYFLGDDIDRKAYISRLEEQYVAVAEKNRAQSQRLDELVEKVEGLAQAQTAGSDALTAVAQQVRELASRAAALRTDPAPGAAPGNVDPRRYQLEVISIDGESRRDPDAVYLPAGSFVHATLLTGVYAPAESNNPLPVLIRLNEAFTGPNGSRIPLQGAFAIGKAVGDLTSERALVQISTIAAVFPTGRTFEHRGNIGYVTDRNGQLGMKGALVRNTGGQMAMSFMTGFMGGASQALADSQTTVVAGDSDHASRNVTGSRAKNAAFSGLAQSAAQLSKYYADQVDQIVPAVKVDAGAEIVVIILEGVRVHGLKSRHMSPVRSID